MLSIRGKSFVGATRARDALKQNPRDDLDWAAYEKTCESIFDTMERLKDPYYRSAAQHWIVRMFTVAGDENAARKIIEDIEIDFIRDKAIADFVAGANSAMKKLEGSDDEVTPRHGDVDDETKPDPDVSPKSERDKSSTITMRLGRVLYYMFYGAAVLWFFGTMIVQAATTSGWWGPPDQGLRGWWATGIWIWPDMTYLIIALIVAVPLWLLARACLYVLAGE